MVEVSHSSGILMMSIKWDLSVHAHILSSLLLILRTLVTLDTFFLSFDSISSTQRRTGTAGKTRDARALWKKGRASYFIWSTCTFIRSFLQQKNVPCELGLAWPNDRSSHCLFPQDRRWQTQETHQEKTSSRGLPWKRARPQDFHGKVRDVIQRWASRVVQRWGRAFFFL